MTYIHLALLDLALPALLLVLNGVKWSPSVGQRGGLDKLGPGFR